MAFYRIRRNTQTNYTSNPIFIAITAILFLFFTIISSDSLIHAEIYHSSKSLKKAYTVMLYLNGDNDLTHEVLYAVDMLETVGSSDYINILALVDGRPGSGHPYGDSWDASRLLYITRDARIGEINSAILQDMGEQNLGQPETLEYFIRKGLRYPAEHYIFCTFTHGRGIIDTKTLKLPRPHKSLAISIDDTDASQMTLSEFQHAVQRGLNGKKFDAMVFFSCLTGMVEVGYAFKDLTDYLIGSEDEIRIVNNPPGSFQIRGIKFEEPLKAIQFNPDLTPYDFAKYVLERLHNSSNVTLLMELRATLTETQRYASFMNLEYYDLQDFFNKLAEKTGNMHLKKTCSDIIDFMKRNVIVYEKHTEDCASYGLSVYLSNFLIPENIFQTHQQMYRESEFSQKTLWDEMIEMIRSRLSSYQD